MKKVDREVIDLENHDFGPIPELIWVPKDRILIDRNYQREILSNHVQRIAVRFNWRFFEPPTITRINQEDPPLYAVINGQHRLAAAKVHSKINLIPCYCVYAPEIAEQAKAFIEINANRIAVNPVAMYWAGLAAQNPIYLEVKEVVEAAGLEIAPTNGRIQVGYINSVASLKRVISRCGKDVTVKTLKLLHSVNPNSTDILVGTMITAISRLLRENSNINLLRLLSVLKRLDIPKIVFDAINTRKVIGGSTETVIIETVRTEYNKGLTDPSTFLVTKVKEQKRRFRKVL